MHISEVTNAQLVEHFEVTIIDSIYAEDSKGRRKFLTDLRQTYAKNFKAIQAKKRAQEKQKVKQTENIEEFFVDLDRAFPDYNVIIRQTQPGIEIPELGLNIYCIVSGTSKHVVSAYSKEFDREYLEKEFGHWKLYKKDDSITQGAITISDVTFSDIIEIVSKLIELHKD